MKTNNNLLCKHLQWESDFFGVNIAKVNSRKMDKGILRKVNEWCQVNNIECLFFLADSSYRNTYYTINSDNFIFVDNRLTLSIDLNKVTIDAANPNLYDIRNYLKPDIVYLKAIANKSHMNTRYYFDKMFPSTLCGQLYEKWIENSCEGYADKVFVAEVKDKVVGYISCHKENTKSGKIGLFAIDSSVRNIGIGYSLVKTALKWFEENSINYVTVVTQGRNIPSQRLYQKCDFRSQSSMNWYHKWFINN